MNQVLGRDQEALLHLPVGDQVASLEAELKELARHMGRETGMREAHQIALDLSGEDRLSLIMEPPAGLLHLWLGGDDGLVSHVTYTGGCYDRFEVFANGDWTGEDNPPAPSIPLQGA